jgi:hypothetical protein
VRSVAFGHGLIAIALARFVVWPYLMMAPHRHIVVDVTVTGARTNYIVHAVGAGLPLHGSLAEGVEKRKLDADFGNLAPLRFSRLTTTIPST